MKKKAPKGPRILLLDIETAPILAHAWALFDQNIGLSQIQQDWFVLSFCAKWLDKKELIYHDQSKAKNVEDDKKLLKKIWKLLDECDIVIGQNSNAFDLKKLNARFIINGLKPPSSYKKIDTVKIARKNFGFTSNKLEYLSDKLCKKYKKLDHKKFPGHKLWVEVLKGNKAAWKEMEEYNKFDVLALEELYHKLQPWDNSINFSLYTDTTDLVCNCGSTEFSRNGHNYSSFGKYQRYTCKKCGKEATNRQNLLSKEKRKSLHK
jgi:uncharacterized protein YprB with RNaseH-like and TPR domain